MSIETRFVYFFIIYLCCEGLILKYNSSIQFHIPCMSSIILLKNVSHGVIYVAVYYLHYEYKHIVRIALASLMYYVICYIFLRDHTILYKNKYNRATHINKFDGFLLFRKICNAYTIKSVCLLLILST